MGHRPDVEYRAGAIAVEQAASTPAAATKQTLSTASLDAGTIAAAEDAGSADAISYSSGGHRDTFIGGVHIGYNHQFENNLVLGAVADLNFLDWDRYVGARYQDHSLEARQSLKYLGTVRAKLGYAADRVLVYGTGGLAYGGIKNSLSVDGATVESDTKTRFGYAVGAGVDFLAFDNVSIGAEYLLPILARNRATTSSETTSGSTACSSRPHIISSKLVGSKRGGHAEIENKTRGRSLWSQTRPSLR
ncbi:porin family protein [Ochrobactrum oryzae]|nr:porin family protein [Brucella oryzae]